MTAVIGLLNKQGVALAADSAVTRSRGNNEKITKNGNKLIRLSNRLPVSVMVTGSAHFLGNPWEILIKKYRQERGDESYPTVEACVDSFIGFISSQDCFWNKEIENSWFCECLDYIVHYISRKIKWPIHEENFETGELIRPAKFAAHSIRILKRIQRKYNRSIDEQTEENILKLKEYFKDAFEEYFNDGGDLDFKSTFRKITERIEDEIWLTLNMILTNPNEIATTILVFSGYGASQKHPSLIAMSINEGFDRFVNRHIEKSVNISDDCPSAICPFAQKDIIDSLLRGAEEYWLRHVAFKLQESLSPERLLVETESKDLDLDQIKDIISEEEIKKLIDRMMKDLWQTLRHHEKQWVKALANYDVKSMASLALSLIDLTSLERILRFQPEGVGGDIDLAVITRNEGFTWLSRKSWYHHKDIGGRYGSMGV